MKLKLKLVAAMSLLGFISCPAFAADDMNQTTTTTTTTATPAPVAKHRHHHKMRHHMVAAHPSYKGDLKGEMIPAPVVEACPINNWYTPTMIAMGQNVGRAVPTVHCYEPISFAGGIATDIHTFNLGKGYMGENNEKISLNDAYLNIFGNVNQYVKAFASISYNNASSTDSTNGNRVYALGGQYSAAYPVGTLTIEQGFINFSDLDNMPVFFQIGKQYADYNRYQIHALERTMTQVLTETLRTSVELGFVTHMGIHGTVTAFDSPDKKTSQNHSQNVYGASLGWDQFNDSLGWDIGVGYMSDMTGANDVAAAVGRDLLTPFNYIHRVAAWSAYGHVNSGPFMFGLNYAAALQSYSGLDLTSNASTGSNAAPKAVDAKVGFAFNNFGLNKNQNVYLGYQKSWQAARIPLPSNRWLLGYGVDVLPNTMLGAEFGHDVAYSQAKNGHSGGNSNTLGLRAAVKFG